jgi:hypothetical protein
MKSLRRFAAQMAPTVMRHLTLAAEIREKEFGIAPLLGE